MDFMKSKHRFVKQWPEVLKRNVIQCIEGSQRSFVSDLGIRQDVAVGCFALYCSEGRRDGLPQKLHVRKEWAISARAEHSVKQVTDGLRLTESVEVDMAVRACHVAHQNESELHDLGKELIGKPH